MDKNRRPKIEKNVLVIVSAIALLFLGAGALLGLWSAREMRASRTRVLDGIGDFERFFKEEGGGFAWVHWSGDSSQEEEMSKRFETSIRCVPFEDQIPAEAKGEGSCILTGKPSKQRVLMSKSY